jgi:hypothetical protein
VLERFGNAALFELDWAVGVGLRPSRHVNLSLHPEDPSGFVPKRLTSEYDREPLALYWSARSATDLPLLAFLAYLHVLELTSPFTPGPRRWARCTLPWRA